MNAYFLILSFNVLFLLDCIIISITYNNSYLFLKKGLKKVDTISRHDIMALKSEGKTNHKKRRIK